MIDNDFVAIVLDERSVKMAMSYMLSLEAFPELEEMPESDAVKISIDAFLIAASFTIDNARRNECESGLSDNEIVSKFKDMLAYAKLVNDKAMRR